MASEEWKTGAEDASKFLSDPAAMAAMKKQVTIGRPGDRHRVLDLSPPVSYTHLTLPTNREV